MTGGVCHLTHEEHWARWKSWRDDCMVCGFAVQDVDQCERGHPDDGVTYCGACGHGDIADVIESLPEGQR